MKKVASEQKNFSKLSFGELKKEAASRQSPFIGKMSDEIIKSLNEFEYNDKPEMVVEKVPVVDNRGRNSEISGKIRELYNNGKGMKFSEIAKELNLKPQHVRNVCVYERKIPSNYRTK